MLQQVSGLLAKNGLVLVSKQVPASSVHATDPSGVAAQQLPHHPRDGGVSGSQQDVEVVGH